MNILGKVLVVVVFVLSVAFAVSQMVLFQQRTQWREEYTRELEKRRSAETRLEDTEGRLDRLKTEFDSVRTEKAGEIEGLEKRLSEREDDITKLEEEKDWVSNDLSSALETQKKLAERLEEKQNTIKEVEAKADELEASLRERKTAVENLEEEKKQLVNTIDGLESDVAELEEARDDALARLEERKKQLADLEARGVRVDIYDPPPEIEGQISRADNDFGVAVINRGSEHGVEVNFDFVAYRGDRFITRLYVMEVHPEYSVARVDRDLSDLQEMPMQRGDTVTTKIR